MAVQKLSERLKENAHVAVLLVLFRKHYPVTILKWDFTADIIPEMPQLFFLTRCFSKHLWTTDSAKVVIYLVSQKIIAASGLRKDNIVEV